MQVICTDFDMYCSYSNIGCVVYFDRRIARGIHTSTPAFATHGWSGSEPTARSSFDMPSPVRPTIYEFSIFFQRMR